MVKNRALDVLKKKSHWNEVLSESDAQPEHGSDSAKLSPDQIVKALKEMGVAKAPMELAQELVCSDEAWKESDSDIPNYSWLNQKNGQSIAALQKNFSRLKKLGTATALRTFWNLASKASVYFQKLFNRDARRSIPFGMVVVVLFFVTGVRFLRERTAIVSANSKTIPPNTFNLETSALAIPSIRERGELLLIPEAVLQVDALHSGAVDIFESFQFSWFFDVSEGGGVSRVSVTYLVEGDWWIEALKQNEKFRDETVAARKWNLDVEGNDDPHLVKELRRFRSGVPTIESSPVFTQGRLNPKGFEALKSFLLVAPQGVDVGAGRADHHEARPVNPSYESEDANALLTCLKNGEQVAMISQYTLESEIFRVFEFETSIPGVYIIEYLQIQPILDLKRAYSIVNWYAFVLPTNLLKAPKTFNSIQVTHKNAELKAKSEPNESMPLWAAVVKKLEKRSELRQSK
jgi:hypothetical protein